MERPPVSNFAKLAVIGVGAFLGGYAANLGPKPALAQIRSLPSQGNPRVQPTFTDTFLVPPQGVRFVNSEGRPVMVLAAQGSQSTLALFDSNGTPSVTIAAGNGGMVNISTATGAQIKASSNNRANVVSLDASGQGTGISLERAGRDSVVLKDDAANGSRLSMANRAGRTALEILFSTNRGTLSMSDDSGQPLATLGFTGTNGTMELKDSKKKTSSQITGEGKVTLTEGDKTLWVAPPADKGGGSGD
ncbi:MAG: hypothetical protein KF857_08630 [Fimbriimonadaceae bacterium]|nr:hypothetical protein [Fimbriimonadaceae bacterium]